MPTTAPPSGAQDFRVRDTSGKEILQINGANINVGGMVMDKLYFKNSADVEFCSVEFCPHSGDFGCSTV